MRRTEPPRVAKWMLDHLMSADANEALAGDLLESFRAGRSAGWYWRQVLAEVANRWIRNFFCNRLVLVFSIAWSMLSPGWNLIFIRLRNQSNFGGFVWRLPWPWSTICDFGLSVVMSLLFVWIGALVFALIIRATFRVVNARRNMRRAFIMSVVGYVAAMACEFIIAFMTNPYSPAHPVDVRTLSLLGVIVNIGIWTIPMCLPYLIGTACALWEASPKVDCTVKLAE